jgi:hypothetical protein
MSVPNYYGVPYSADVAPSTSYAASPASGYGGYGGYSRPAADDPVNLFPQHSPSFSLEAPLTDADAVIGQSFTAAVGTRMRITPAAQQSFNNNVQQTTSHIPSSPSYASDDGPSTAGTELDSSSNWAKLQISPNIVGSVPYGNFRINVYEHSANQRNAISNENAAADNKNNLKKFYYAPISLLDHASAVSSFNNVTQQAEMRFRVEM